MVPDEGLSVPPTGESESSVNANVLNRYSEPIEVQFDAAYNPDNPYRWEPGEVKSLPKDVAMFCRAKGVVKEDPVTGKKVRGLLVQGVDQEYEEVARSGDFLPHRGAELLDRSNMDAAARAVTILPIANQSFVATDREGVSPESHSRRVID